MRRSARGVGVRATPFLLLLLVCACSAIGGDSGGLGALVPDPPTIDAGQAADHVGQFVSVRATIASARIQSGNVLLEPAAGTPDGLVIEIVPPLVGPGADQLVARYAGQRVVATGRISDFGGRLEMLVGDPGRVRIDTSEEGVPAVESSSVTPAAVAVPGTPAAVAAPAEPDAVAVPGTPAAVAAPGTPAAVAAPGTPAAVAAPGTPAAVAAPAAPAAVAAPGTSEAECSDARLRLEGARSRARPFLETMLACLEEGSPNCTGADDRARLALADLAAAEERLRWVCGEGR
jgi:hypothetical protein